MMKRMEEKETRGEEPDLCGTQYTAPPHHLALFLGSSACSFSQHSRHTLCVGMQHLRLGRKGEGCGWHSARVSSRAHFDG